MPSDEPGLGIAWDADAAIRALRALREKLLGAGRREEWQRASRELITEKFCDDVEQGRLEAQVSSWR